MAKVRVNQYPLWSDIKDEDLRDEAEGWHGEGQVLAGTAILVPDDGSGPAEGFYCVRSGRGMVCWGGVIGDWVLADSLEDMFKTYMG